MINYSFEDMFIEKNMCIEIAKKNNDIGFRSIYKKY
jgi:hypothetical protein